MSTKTTQNQAILIALVSINLIFCGKHEIKKEGAAATDVPVAENTNTQQAANTALDDANKNNEVKTETPPPVDETAKAKPIVRDLTPDELRQITPPDGTVTTKTPEEIQKEAEDRRALLESNKIAAQAKIDEQIAAKKAFREQVQKNLVEINQARAQKQKENDDRIQKDKDDAIAKENERLEQVIVNPYKSIADLLSTTIYADDDKAKEIINQDQISVGLKEGIEKQYFTLLENSKNQAWAMKDRLGLHFLAAKGNAGIREDLKKHLGNFQAAYDAIKIEDKKAILLPLFYAFNLYNKVNGTAFTAEQGPGVYVSNNADTGAAALTTILGRIDLSTESDVTDALSPENVELAKAMNQIWEQYFLRYLGDDTQNPLANPRLVGYTNKNNGKALENAKARAKKVREASVIDEKAGSYFPTVEDMSGDYLFLLDNTKVSSDKNKRVELVLSREIGVPGTTK